MNIHFKNGVSTDLTVDRTVKQAKSSGLSTTQGASQDRATFSTAGQTVPKLVQSVLTTPATRQDRVNSIRNSITAGTYDVDSGKIASSILSENGV